jgi:hypothetical protein
MSFWQLILIYILLIIRNNSPVGCHAISIDDRPTRTTSHRLRLFRDEDSGEGEVSSEASLRHEQDLRAEPSDFYAKGLVGKSRVNAT